MNELTFGRNSVAINYEYHIISTRRHSMWTSSVRGNCRKCISASVGEGTLHYRGNDGSTLLSDTWKLKVETLPE